MLITRVDASAIGHINTIYGTIEAHIHHSSRGGPEIAPEPRNSVHDAAICNVQ